METAFLTLFRESIRWKSSIFSYICSRNGLILVSRKSFFRKRVIDRCLIAIIISRNLAITWVCSTYVVLFTYASVPVLMLLCYLIALIKFIVIKEITSPRIINKNALVYKNKNQQNNWIGYYS